jgi:hypothetical protein
VFHRAVCARAWPQVGRRSAARCGPVRQRRCRRPAGSACRRPVGVARGPAVSLRRCPRTPAAARCGAAAPPSRWTRCCGSGHARHRPRVGWAAFAARSAARSPGGPAHHPGARCHGQRGPCGWHPDHRRAGPGSADTAAAARCPEAGLGALRDQSPFELGDGTQHLQREHALWRGGVDRVA